MLRAGQTALAAGAFHKQAATTCILMCTRDNGNIRCQFFGIVVFCNDSTGRTVCVVVRKNIPRLQQIEHRTVCVVTVYANAAIHAIGKDARLQLIC